MKIAGTMNHDGISMVEVIIAIFIFGLMSITVSTIITSALQGNRISGKRMIASNLAQEGSEAMLNILNSNLLNYSANKEECWNFWEQPDIATPIIHCDPSSPHKIPKDTYFIIQLGNNIIPSGTNVPYTYKWFLTQPNIQVDIKDLLSSPGTDFNDYKVQYRDLLPSFDGKDADSNTKNDREHSIYSTSNSVDTFDTKPFTYYRQIYVTYMDRDGNPSDEDGKFMQVTSTVVWLERGILQSEKLTTQLTNYSE